MLIMEEAAKVMEAMEKSERRQHDDGPKAEACVLVYECSRGTYSECERNTQLEI